MSDTILMVVFTCRPKDPDSKKNSHITDYFPVRRSDRRCKSDLDVSTRGQLFEINDVVS